MKNLNGTSNRKCPCGSWIQHWTNYSGAANFPKKCAVKGCDNEPSVGAHVKYVGTDDHRHYIILTCHACNAKRGAELDVHHYVKPVWANVSGTCGDDTWTW